tara:strand:- start:499 stop:711 length:213 start_codon:yes stop_codon:yes gene_type:complete
MKLCSLLIVISIFLGANQKTLADLSAGAVQVDITLRKIPVIVSGGFLTKNVRIIADRLHSRVIVISLSVL